MKYRLNVTNQTRDDITRNAAWWAEHYSVEQALKWYDAVYKQLGTLLTFPESHSLADENDDFPYEIREMLVGGKKRTYRAIFTISESEVRVLTVRRASQGAVTSEELPE